MSTHVNRTNALGALSGSGTQTTRPRGARAQAASTVLAALLAAAASATPANANDFVVPVDAGFEPGSLTISGYGKGYEFVIDVRGVKGEVFVCGAGIYPDASSAVGVRRMLRGAAITVNGRKVIQDLTFFTKVARGADLFKAQAVCRGTGTPAPKGPAKFGIEWPSGPIRF